MKIGISQPAPVPDPFVIRRATTADIEVIARHRAAMFRDMGSAGEELIDDLTSATLQRLEEAMPRGEYLGWLASPQGQPESIVAGAGVQLRLVLPFPHRRPDGPVELARGRQAIVLNVYTEPAWRRRGLARRLMLEVLSWARTEALDSLVLHAAPEGRALYEALGFVATNEMRYAGDLARPTAAGG